MEKREAYHYEPDDVSPPGGTLADLLEERGMSQAELAERTGRPRKTINEIIQGKAALTPETALQLERVLGMPASFWLVREQRYREQLARQQDERALVEQAGWLDGIPVQDMVQAGWIKEQPDKLSLLREVLGFYAIATPAQYAGAGAALGHAQATQSDPDAVAAWLRQGDRLAQEVACAPYSAPMFRAALARARQLTRAPIAEAWGETVLRCADAGVALIRVAELPSMRVCGATRWASPARAVIQISSRCQTDEQLWLSLAHAAGHLLLHGKRDSFLDEEERSADAREAEADQFAIDWLLPPAARRRFHARRGAVQIDAPMVAALAGELGLAPGVVVGCLWREGSLPRPQLAELARPLGW